MADPTGIVARTIAALRYAVTGNAPQDWFGPGTPLPDQAPPDVKGRGWDFPNFTNINYTPRKTERIDFKKLKLLATHCEPLKLVMGRQRSLMTAMEWSIKPKVKADAKKDDPAIATITEFFEQPDKLHDWAQWLGAFLDQVFVYDALSIYSRPTVGGDLFALQIIDGATITPLVDAWGYQPLAPAEGYQQVLKGLPAVKYTSDELLYYPENYRVDHIYGNSRVERIVTIVETSIAQLASQQAYFTHGNIGDGFFAAPPNWQPDQIKQFEAAWNAQMSADGGLRIADRRQAPWLPNGVTFNPTQVDLFQQGFDEWLIRLICFAFDVAPTPFLKQMGMGHGSASSDKESAEEGGVAQLMQLVRRVMNRLIATKFGRKDLEFAWTEDRELDPKVANDIDDKNLRNGSKTIDEVRDRRGDEPLPDGLGKQPIIYTSTGGILVETVLSPPPPPPVPDMTGHNGGPPLNDNEPKPGAELAPAEKLAKEAGGADQAKFTNLIASYLSKRGAIIAKQIADALGISTPDAAAIATALDGVDWDWSDLADSAETILSGIAVSAGTEAVSKLGLFDKETLAKVAERATDYARDRAAEMVGKKVVDGELVDNPDASWSISSATRDMLRGTITNAVEAGASNDMLAKDIADSAAFSRERAMTIARTETAKADVQGSRAGWKASGLVAGRQWLAGDGCCDECQALDGEIVGIDEEFPDGDAPLHPNCECTELAVLPEDMPDGADDAETEE